MPPTNIVNAHKELSYSTPRVQPQLKHQECPILSSERLASGLWPRYMEATGTHATRPRLVRPRIHLQKLLLKAIFSIQHVFLERQRITIAIGGGITGFKDTTSSANLDHLTHILAVDVKMCRLIMSPFAKDIPRHCYVGSVILVYRPLRELESIASAFPDRQPKVQVD
ncbi:predicted protein [Plenodomus lingam JN3]|uniref:Predicted protein n=1 Tax=Leptosphaeria maculans (strain JN3 / isolate v23.1.3 / race Av1-4-5-6-7-8) TaxID=985895 RepID=E5AEE3_LEPMJ|nr:predicted protein [Plenodomus lingam JN3]CBY01582.1 predicted protein [Plenodomus lingam JN3]